MGRIQKWKIEIVGSCFFKMEMEVSTELATGPFDTILSILDNTIFTVY